VTFSLRTALVGVAVVAVWLAALLSGSELFVAAVSSLALVSIFLALALAIWEPRAEALAFWSGYFVVSVGLLLIGSFTVGSATWAYRSIRDEMADVLHLQRPRPESSKEFVPAPPSMYSGDGPPPYVSLLAIALHEERTVLINGVNVCLATFAGAVAGWICGYRSRPGS
jgi:hypothetical protein